MTKVSLNNAAVSSNLIRVAVLIKSSLLSQPIGCVGDVVPIPSGGQI